MMAPFTILFTTFMSFITLAVSLPLSMHIQTRDVFVPLILSPQSGAVWIAGQYHNVTWDTNNAPANITNKYGMIYLRNNNLTDMNEELASGFNILDGVVEIQVPEVPMGHNYSLVLFGDSGNFSPSFTILPE
ncbi:hypothetical protein PAXRUDRAFT_145298 [Paxillus rubicundulus Ve08.2h10]|uniref:Yeast cell wall synthesis Kre9/Knh1-like N-terminal domain-containing protein n=1 Tax=Paxillus rubicundulus Ve08.2h10 TaxID=930991 RepID=A0A0D0E0I8_9AGAM|nr:hypothetical protein PAXRUDRAFT_145298 [Paxillus rubicundulus Ve08.2h10]